MTLTQIAVITKQVITLSIIVLILGVASFIGYKIWYAYYLAHLPPVEEKPDAKFGNLPFPDFPKVDVSSSNYSYSIDTATGGLPRIGVDAGFNKLIKVFFIPKTFATLLSAEKSQNLAAKFDINSSPQTLSETNYLYKSGGGKTLNVDLDSGNFVYKNEATASGKENLDSDNKVVADFEKVLNNLGVFKPDLSKGRTKMILLKRSGNELTTATLQTEAEAAQISLWPSPLETVSIFTPEFNKSLISATVIKSAGDISNYLSLEFTYFPVDTSTFATYPIKTAETALEDLKTGKGVIIIVPDKPNVSITSVYLGYFLPKNYSPYLQPIFVFEGPQFAAYVAAITEQYLAPAR